MSEERRMILNMLSEKKITADEAAELLRALGPAVAAGPGAEQAPNPPTTPGYDASHGASSGDTPGHSRSILEGFLSHLDIDWGNLPFAFGGEAYRFEEKHHGRFDAGDGPINLDLSARNGRVEVFAWDRPEWRAVVRKKIRASSEEQARQRGQEIAVLRGTPTGLTFEERTFGWGNTGVSIEVWVPKNLIYEVNARSSNGRVVLDGLRCAGLVAKTANGKVGVRIADAGVAEVATANGQITFEGSADKINCHTANGSIKFYPLPRREMLADVHTANGSIKVWVPHDDSVGYEVEARTGFGGLEVDLPDFITVENERQFGRRLLRGHSVNLAGKERKLAVTARTTNGSVRIMPRRAGDVWEDSERPAREPDDLASNVPQDEPGGLPTVPGGNHNQ